ncbi:hypothetical protein MPER_15347, partial [Moniliophthora perniciosa FA553]
DAHAQWMLTDAGGVDLLQNQHFVCETRECSAKTAVENYSGEMGGGTYTYLTLVDQVNAGKVDIKYIGKHVDSVHSEGFLILPQMRPSNHC